MKNGRFLTAKKPVAMNDTAKPGSIGGFQYFERKDNEGFDGRVGQIVWKTLSVK